MTPTQEIRQAAFAKLKNFPKRMRFGDRRDYNTPAGAGCTSRGYSTMPRRQR